MNYLKTICLAVALLVSSGTNPKPSQIDDGTLRTTIVAPSPWRLLFSRMAANYLEYVECQDQLNKKVPMDPDCSQVSKRLGLIIDDAVAQAAKEDQQQK